MAGRIATAARPPIAGLYAVTPELADTRELIARVAAAIDGGANAIQWRNKLAAASVRREQARALRELCAARAITYIINDDVELAHELAADGVHLGRDDATIAAARQRLGPGAIVGASCYASLDRAEQVVAAGADYVAFGSFFASRVKPEATRASVSLLAAAKARWRVPVVAIGGITAAHAPALIAAGADALAVVSAVFDAPDVSAAARAFCDAFASGSRGAVPPRRAASPAHGA
jgi:thiamine-phosphate pyrophosphorylase